MRSTIRDVASKAGVSIATVSRALRDPQIVSPATQHKVAQAAAELEYVPSHLGRQLAERRHAANGIVFPDLSGPYFAEVVLGYEDVAAELGRSVLILSTHGREGAPAMVTDLAGRTDGLVVLGRTVSDDVLHTPGSPRHPARAAGPDAAAGDATRSTPRTTRPPGRSRSTSPPRASADHPLRRRSRDLARRGRASRRPPGRRRGDGAPPSPSRSPPSSTSSPARASAGRC